MAKETFSGNVRSAPVWAKDFGGREHIMPFPAKLNAAAFADSAGVPVQVTANAAQGATSITVAALTLATLANTIVISQGNVLIPSGTVLDFGGAKFARLTADAAIGDTALTVAALPAALTTTDATTYSNYGTETIPSGTAIGRTFAMRDAGTPFVAADPAAHDEIFLTVFDVSNAKTNNDVELYRPTSLVAENYLPGYTTVLAPGGTPSALLTKLRGIYQCIKGVD